MLQAFAARQERSQRDQRTNPLLEQMNSFLQFVAAMIAAGSFGVAVVQTAMTEPLQQHSGTQSYVRMVR